MKEELPKEDGNKNKYFISQVLNVTSPKDELPNKNKKVLKVDANRCLMAIGTYRQTLTLSKVK